MEQKQHTKEKTVHASCSTIYFLNS